MRTTLRIRWSLLIAAAVLAPGLVDKAYAAPAPPSHVVALLTAEKGVEGARCVSGPTRDHAPTYLCAVRVRGGCVAALFQFRHGELGWYRTSARPVKCWKTDGGPTA